MAAKFKLGDEVITKYNVWPGLNKEIGKITDMYKRDSRYLYRVQYYSRNDYDSFYATELNKYINTIDDLL